jgi:hypothetical protein
LHTDRRPRTIFEATDEFRALTEKARYNAKGETSVSKSSRTLRSTILLFVVSVAVIAADLVIVSAQGDQTRGGQMTSNDNMQGNMGNGNMGGGRRRRRRRTGGGATATTNSDNTSGGDMGAMQGNANTGDATMTANTGGGGGRRRRRRRSGGGATATTTTGVMTTTTPVADSVQTDLSGTYTGTLSCTGIPATGEGTLTITGNQYTFAPSGGGGSINGRIVAVTTRGYTAVAMQYGESVAPPPGQTSTPPVIVSLRARKMGDNLTLSGVQGTATKDCSFSSGSPVRTGGRRRRGRM